MPSSRRPHPKIRRQLSIRHASNRPMPIMPEPDTYNHMFREDVALGMIPLVNRNSRPGFRVNLTTPEATRDVEVGLALEGGAERNLAGSLGSFLRKTVTEILTHGCCAYEIAYLAEDESSPPTRFQLSYVDMRDVSERNGDLVQHVDPDIAKSRGVATEIVLCREDVFVMDLPKDQAPIVRDLTQGLRRIGGRRSLEFFLEAQRQKLPYDYRQHDRIRMLALAEASRLVGWTARGTFNGAVLSYYWIQLQLDFEVFKLRLREHLLSQLNQILQRAGTQVGFPATIVIEGLPTLDEIATARDQLRNGEMPFTDIMKPFTL